MQWRFYDLRFSRGGGGGGGAHRKSNVPQHKWDDIKRALHKYLDNSSLFYK